MLDRLFGRSSKGPPPPEVVRDICLGEPRVRLFRRLLEQGQWKKVHDEFGRIDHPDVRELAVTACVEWPGRPVWLDAWNQAYPDDPLGWTLRGAHGIRWAWEARGGGRAADVVEDAWPTFLKRLLDADGELARAAELAPADPLPWKHRIISAMGLNAPVEVRRAHFDEAVRRCPTLFGAHFNMLTACAEKWGGSHDEMFELARGAARRAPAGSALPALLTIAHTERWLYFSFDEDHEGMNAYFGQPEVRREIERIAPACGSIQVPHLARFAANALAFCFWMMGQRSAARIWFERAGGIFYGSPWHYLGEGVEKYRDARAECL